MPELSHGVAAKIHPVMLQPNLHNRDPMAVAAHPTAQINLVLKLTALGYPPTVPAAS